LATNQPNFMSLRELVVQEYLERGASYRGLAQKYRIGQTTVYRWVKKHQGIHNLPLTVRQQKYFISSMESPSQKKALPEQQSDKGLEEKIAALEKQLHWEKLRADALDTMITIAEKQLDISIRKKSGNPRSKK
jgi:transposase-like protein